MYKYIYILLNFTNPVLYWDPCTLSAGYTPKVFRELFQASTGPGHVSVVALENA